MVNDFFKQNELTNNSNFIGDSCTPKTIYKVHVRGRKEVIVRLINDIINVHSRDQITPADDEMRIVSALHLCNSFIKSIPHFEMPATSNENNIHFDRYKEVDGECLLSFYVGEAPRRKWGLLVEPYSQTEWIIDEYRECWYLDESGVEYKFRHSYIYQNYGQFPLKSTYSTDQMDSLMEKYPVHFGCIRLEKLRMKSERHYSDLIKYKAKITDDKFKQMNPEFQKTLLSIFLIHQRDLVNAEHEIEFIKNMWMTLNEKLYGYDDTDLSLRYRGIDVFSPICNMDLTFVDENNKS